MAWWILEVLTTALLVVIACWLGPLIKRFGRSYAADVFRANPRTGKSFVMLTDVAYYLIFFAYILFTVTYAPRDAWADTVNADAAAARDGTGRRDPAHHRRAPRREPAGHAGDGPPADVEPAARRADAAGRPRGLSSVLAAVVAVLAPACPRRPAPPTTTTGTGGRVAATTAGDVGGSRWSTGWSTATCSAMTVADGVARSRDREAVHDRRPASRCTNRFPVTFDDDGGAQVPVPGAARHVRLRGGLRRGRR